MALADNSLPELNSYKSDIEKPFWTFDLLLSCPFVGICTKHLMKIPSTFVNGTIFLLQMRVICLWE